MLRACHEVLRAGGRLVGYVIHMPADASPEEAARASRLGPAEIAAEASPAELAREAGFEVHEVRDVTAAFAHTCEALLEARMELEAELRKEEGDDVFEKEREDKALMLQGIQEGLLRRALIVAVARRGRTAER